MRNCVTPSRGFSSEFVQLLTCLFRVLASPNRCMLRALLGLDSTALISKKRTSTCTYRGYNHFSDVIIVSCRYWYFSCQECSAYFLNGQHDLPKILRLFLYKNREKKSWIRLTCKPARRGFNMPSKQASAVSSNAPSSLNTQQCLRKTDYIRPYLLFMFLRYSVWSVKVIVTCTWIYKGFVQVWTKQLNCRRSMSALVWSLQ